MAQRSYPACSYRGVRLHSSFDPEKEAERCIAAAVPADFRGWVVLVGVGLNYLTQAVRRRTRHATVVSVYLTSHHARSAVCHSDFEWVPTTDDAEPAACATALQRWLRTVLNAAFIQMVRIVPWQPAARANPPLFAAIMSAVRQVTARAGAVAATDGYFGRRWLSNACRNAFTAANGNAPTHWFGRAPWLIFAGGPSVSTVLNEARTVLRQNRSVRVCAVPAAGPAIHAAGITIDLLVATDGGFFSGYQVLRAPPVSCIAAPLTAHPAAFRTPTPRIVLDQGEPLDAALIAASAAAGLRVAPQPTVVLTAIEVVRRLGAEWIGVIGLDFAAFDLHDHVEPDPLAHWRRQNTNRLRPDHAQRYRRRFMNQGNAAGPQHLPNGWWTDRSWVEFHAAFNDSLSDADDHPPVRRLKAGPVQCSAPHAATDACATDACATDACAADACAADACAADAGAADTAGSVDRDAATFFAELGLWQGLPTTHEAAVGSAEQRAEQQHGGNGARGRVAATIAAAADRLERIPSYDAFLAAMLEPRAPAHADALLLRRLEPAAWHRLLAAVRANNPRDVTGTPVETLFENARGSAVQWLRAHSEQQ